MKAVAEFDMPRGCYFCPFLKEYTDWCWMLKRKTMGAHMYREKDCPLREKKEDEDARDD